MTSLFPFLINQLRSDWLANPKELDLVISSLETRSYKFSPMQRSWVPKANKPGSLRAITKPASKDIPLLQSLSVVLEEAYSDVFLESSHGFRKRKGVPTFLRELHGWKQLDRLIKTDIVRCFDSLSHRLLRSFLFQDLGQENEEFIELIFSFLKASIFDSQGADFSFTTKGVPQGSSFSPILMNIYLHRLDLSMSKFQAGEESFRYVRYADDMAIGIGLSHDSQGVYRRFQRAFRESLGNLELQESSVELRRFPRGKTLLLGLRTSLSEEGLIETRVPFPRWTDRISLEFLKREMRRLGETEEQSLFLFLRALEVTLVSRIALAYSSSMQDSERRMRDYFTGLSKTRIQEFLVGKKRTAAQQRKVDLFLAKIKDWVKNGKRKREKEPNPSTRKSH